METHPASMVVTIAVEGQQPVRGSVTVDGGPPRPFVGLLQLLRILSELLAPQAAPRDA